MLELGTQYCPDLVRSLGFQANSANWVDIGAYAVGVGAALGIDLASDAIAQKIKSSRQRKKEKMRLENTVLEEAK
jgi:shikimate kinase